MFAVIGNTEVLSFAPDDIYSMILISVQVLKSLFKPAWDADTTGIKWIEDQAFDLLEMTYFNHDLLTKVLPEVLASAIVIAALTVLTQDKILTVHQVPRTDNYRNVAVALKLSDYWGVSHRSLCKIT